MNYNNIPYGRGQASWPQTRNDTFSATRGKLVLPETLAYAPT